MPSVQNNVNVRKTAVVAYRSMRPGDYAACYALWQQVPGMHLRPRDDSEAAIRRVILANPDLCWVALVAGKIVGTIIGASDGRRGTIYHLAVAPQFRRQGIATTLVANVQDGLAAQGIRKTRVFVVDENVAGQEFWRQHGFAVRTDVQYMDQER